MGRFVRLALLVSLPALGACGGGSSPRPGGPPSIALAGGDHQVGIPGAALTTSLRVRVVDATGSGVGGVVVAWAVAGGGGRVWAARGATDASGEAWAIATLGPAPGTHGFTATAAGLAGSPVVFTATSPAFTPGFSVAHSGLADPAQEGFGIWPYLLGQSSEGPVGEDVGRDVWRIEGQTQSQQYAYYAAPLSAAQQSAFETDGFGLTVIARVQRGLAPAFSAARQAPVAVVAVSTGTKRFDVELGVDAAGDTVVLLPDSVGYSAGTFLAPGTSLTLTGSGSSYHTCQLVYDPGTRLADLYVDGVARLHGYGGLSIYSADEGASRGLYSLLPAGVNGGQASFHLVELTSPARDPVVP